jgi:hypothetical protein
MNLRSVQKILGHSTIQVTERDAHLSPDFPAKEADLLCLYVSGWGQVVALRDAQASK